MLALFILFLTCVLAHTCLTYVIFWYEIANSTCGKNQQGQSEQSFRPLIAGGILSGFLSLSLVILSYPLGFLSGRERTILNPTGSSRPPIILAHGLYHNAGAWLLYRRWLKREGFENVYEFSYSSWKSTFPQILAELGVFIKQVSSLHPQQPVFLIGHSMGGLLCRAHMEQSGKAAGNVAAVVTLGSPHQGTKLSVLGVGRLAQSLAFRGPLIRKLEDQGKPPGIPCLAVFSPADNMVLPSTALRVPFEGWLYHETSPISHLAMLYHKPTARIIMEFLKGID